jgi:alkylhydroperoxidase family enzyme
VSRGLSEELVAKLHDYENSDLPERTKWALRLADRISEGGFQADESFYEFLRKYFTEDQILDLGMTIAFMFGWQRFIEAFGIVPDRWQEGTEVMPWQPEAPEA